MRIGRCEYVLMNGWFQAPHCWKFHLRKWRPTLSMFADHPRVRIVKLEWLGLVLFCDIRTRRSA